MNEREEAPPVEPDTQSNRLGLWQRYHGIALTALVVTALQPVPVHIIPNPGSYYALAVAYTSAVGGLVAGLASAVFGIVAILIDASIPGKPFEYTPQGMSRVLGNIIALFGTALVVGFLKHRNDALAAENATRLIESRTRAIETAATKANEAKLARLAETLQRSLLLTPPKDTLRGIRLSKFYESAWDEAEVGGDFYDAFILENGMIALVVGDVTGKGLVAAARTAEVKFVLRAYLREDPTSAARAVARLNRFLCSSSAFVTDEVPTEYVCLSLALLDPTTGKTQIVAAGAEPPLIVRGGKRPAVETTIGEQPNAPGSCPLLGVDSEAPYESTTVTLTPSDALLLLTDGLTEARRPSDHAFFADTELQSTLLRTNGRLPATEEGDRVLQALTDTAKAFVGGQLRDDVCLLLARRR